MGISVLDDALAKVASVAVDVVGVAATRHPVKDIHLVGEGAESGVAGTFTNHNVDDDECLVGDGPGIVCEALAQEEQDRVEVVSVGCGLKDGLDILCFRGSKLEMTVSLEKAS